MVNPLKSLLLSILLHLFLLSYLQRCQPTFGTQYNTCTKSQKSAGTKLLIKHIPKQATTTRTSTKKLPAPPSKKTVTANTTSTTEHLSDSSNNNEHRATPTYPQISRLRGEEGLVLIKIVLHPKSNQQPAPPYAATIIKSSGHNRLDRAALDAAVTSLFQIPPAHEDQTLFSKFIQYQFSLTPQQEKLSSSWVEGDPDESY
ncbi:MAG: TonB family protein [Oligoflexia bacterium]|nr:TonB family protein [Oligoflexia bacterium]